MPVEIYEDRLDQKISGLRNNMNTEEQIRRGDYYALMYQQRRGEIGEYREEWSYLKKLYECERDPDPEDDDAPNSFIPLLTPVIEGQTASMIEADIEFRYVTSIPSHESAMIKLDAASKYNRRKSQYMRHIKDMTRQYLLLGNCWVTVAWEESISNRKDQPSGYPQVSIPDLDKVFVDGRIKDYKDIQHADYIIHEIGFQSIEWARLQYGDEMAEAITVGTSQRELEDPDNTFDDSKSFCLLHVWTRMNEYKNLQLIEMDSSGLILRESDPSKPYYEAVDNEYPFVFVRGNPRIGRFYGFGDGKILKPMQECVNALTDELELAARFSSQSQTYIDPSANVDDSQITSDPRKFCLAENPRQNIYNAPPAGVSPTIQNMIEYMLREAERATRFSSIMTGNMQGSSATATQVNGQLSQGAVGIKDKKSDIAFAMAWADRYMLRLSIEKWKVPFWAQLTDGKQEYLDMEELRNVPSSVPLTAKTAISMISEGLSENAANYELALDDEGNQILGILDFDVEVVMGSGIPRGKNDMYNIILGLMQIQVMGASGQPEPFLATSKARKLMEEALGIKLSDDEEGLGSPEGQLMGGMNPGQVNPLPEEGGVASPQGNQMSQEAMQNTMPGISGMDLRGIL